MNIPNVAWVGLLSICLCLVLTGCLFGLIPLVEDFEVILESQQLPLEEPFRSALADSPRVTAAVLFSFFVIPGGSLAAVGYGLWWLLTRGRDPKAIRISHRRLWVGQLVGLLTFSAGLVPLLYAVPTIILAPQVISVQREMGDLPAAEHPVLIVVSVLLIMAAGPFTFGSGLLVLAHRDWRSLKSQPKTAESEEARARRDQWNLRVERLCLLMGCGVVLSLIAISFFLLRNVISEYHSTGAEWTVQQRIALTPSGYLSGICLLGIPGLISAFLMVGFRLLLARPDPFSVDQAGG